MEVQVAYAAVEGIFFSGSFCAIFWLKKRGLMPGLTFSNELISRDEGLHTDFGCVIYMNLKHKLPQQCVQQIIREAVVVERKFICESLPCDLIGMNSGKPALPAFITLLSGYGTIYRICSRQASTVTGSTPNIQSQKSIRLDGPDLSPGRIPKYNGNIIVMQGKTNFFEKRVGEYQKSGIMANEESQKFSTDADF